ncbi:MAG: TolC family protein [Thermodesulfovibrionales bacterium]|nr:TolC family protein [Thermodesulfovibrionales bacterium]
MYKTFKVIICVIIAFIFYIGVSGTDNSFAEEYSLEDLYRIALERAERIKISEEDLYIAEKGKDKALSVLLPKLSTFWDYTRYSEAKTTGTGWIIQPDYSTSWGLRLDQSMSLSGRELKAFKISKENIEKSGYDLYAVREEYLFSVSSAYYDVLRAKKALEIARANVERLIKHRDAAAIRLKVGEVTKTDLLRAEAELSGAQSEMVKAENNLKLAKAVLARIVGIYEEYTLKETPLEEPVYLFLPSLREEARMQRAELKSSELQKKIAEDQVKYAKGAYWPTLSVEGVYLRKDEDPASSFFLKESIYGGLTLNFPFFEGGLRRAEVREAKARQRQSELIYEDLRKTINIEVENAYLDFMTQKGVLKSLEDEVTFARDNYNSISRQYEFGLANSIDVIDANTLLLTSERQLSDAQYNYELAILRVERATGTLLKSVVSQQSGAGSQ